MKKTTFACALGLASLSALTTTTVFAAPTSPQIATQNLVKELSHIQNMTANFSQNSKLTNPSKKAVAKKSLAQSMNQSFSGIMKVARPGKFYWETIQPSKQTIITTGKTVWIYDPDLKQAIKQSLDEQVANTPALLLSGNTQQIMQAYSISQPDSSKRYYELRPKSKESAFEVLYLSFGANNAPTRMTLLDSMGQTTIIDFKNVKLNTAINQSIFNFTPPQGTDIVTQ